MGDVRQQQQQQHRIVNPEPVYPTRAQNQDCGLDCDSTDPRSDDYGSSVTRPEIPIVIVDEPEDDSDWLPPPPTLPPTGKQDSQFLPYGDRKMVALQRTNAVDLGCGDVSPRSRRLARNVVIDGESVGNDWSTDDGSSTGYWLRTESEI